MSAGLQYGLAELDLGDFFLQQCGGLNEAFGQLDLAGTGSINQEQFVEGLRCLQYPGDASIAFQRMSARSGGLQRLELYDFIKYFASGAQSPSPPCSEGFLPGPSDIQAMVRSEVIQAVVELARSQPEVFAGNLLAGQIARWENQAKATFEAQLKSFAVQFEESMATTVTKRSDDAVLVWEGAKEPSAPSSPGEAFIATTDWVTKMNTGMADVEKELRGQMVVTELAVQGLTEVCKELQDEVGSVQDKLRSVLATQQEAVGAQKASMEAMQQKLVYTDKKLKVFIERAMDWPEGMVESLEKRDEASLGLDGSSRFETAQFGKGSVSPAVDGGNSTLQTEVECPNLIDAFQAYRKNLLSLQAQDRPILPLASHQDRGRSLIPNAGARALSPSGITSNSSASTLTVTAQSLPSRTSQSILQSYNQVFRQVSPQTTPAVQQDRLARSSSANVDRLQRPVERQQSPPLLGAQSPLQSVRSASAQERQLRSAAAVQKMDLRQHLQKERQPLQKDRQRTPSLEQLRSGGGFPKPGEPGGFPKLSGTAAFNTLSQFGASKAPQASAATPGITPSTSQQSLRRPMLGNSASVSAQVKHHARHGDAPVTSGKTPLRFRPGVPERNMATEVDIDTGSLMWDLKTKKIPESLSYVGFEN